MDACQATEDVPPAIQYRKLQPIPPNSQIVAANLKVFLYKANFRIVVFIPSDILVENATPNVSAWVWLFKLWTNDRSTGRSQSAPLFLVKPYIPWWPSIPLVDNNKHQQNITWRQQKTHKLTLTPDILPCPGPNLNAPTFHIYPQIMDNSGEVWWYFSFITVSVFYGSVSVISKMSV